MDAPIPYRIVRTKRRRRTLSLCIEHDGLVVIRAPYGIPTSVVEEFFNEKKPWIYRKLRQMPLGRREPKPKEFVSGEEFLYLGGSYPLGIIEHADHRRPLVLSDDRFCLDERHRDKARDLFIRWYKEQAEITLRERLKFFSRQLQLFPQRERISSARHQWGGCSPKNTVSFSWRLVMAPLPIIDYIVVHELAHIKEKNHSPRFWKIVETTLKDYRERRDWLKRNGHRLSFE